MKKQYLLLLLPFSFILFFSCETELPNHLTFDSYMYATTDETGGDWEPVYLTGTGLVVIPEPEDITSDNYLDELATVKSFNQSLTNEEQAAVDYWGNNSIIRWFEITEELIAKYNLAPSPDENDEYGVPDGVSATILIFLLHTHLTPAEHMPI